MTVAVESEKVARTQLLSLGPEVEVLAPEGLRACFAEDARRLAGGLPLDFNGAYGRHVQFGLESFDNGFQRIARVGEMRRAVEIAVRE